MQSEKHDRARTLIDRKLIDGLCADDEEWLREHLAGCTECAAWSESTARMLRSMRSLSFQVDGASRRQVMQVCMAGKQKGPRLPVRFASLAAAITIALGVPAFYHRVSEKQRDAEDQKLMESVAANLSRGCPEALEPLRGWAR